MRGDCAGDDHNEEMDKWRNKTMKIEVGKKYIDPIYGIVEFYNINFQETGVIHL